MALPQLDATLDEAWRTLERGVSDRRHGFHTPTVCTVDPQGAPSGRVVVLRAASRADRRLAFHTDRRSAKVDHLAQGLSWVFYDAAHKLQVRVHGPARLAPDDVRAAHWARSSAASRKCYLADPGPGTALGDAWGTGMPPELDGPVVPELDQTRPGWDVFRVIESFPTSLESLWLSRQGHQRARFTWTAEGWTGAWLVP